MAHLIFNSFSGLFPVIGLMLPPGADRRKLPSSLISSKNFGDLFIPIFYQCFLLIKVICFENNINILNKKTMS